MASIYDKLAQAKYEEKLKATIITLAKGLYSQGEVLDITYDVVTGFADSDGKTDILAWVISYEDDSNHLKRHTYIQSKQCVSLEDAYLSLIQALRCLMTGDMASDDNDHVQLAEEVCEQVI